MGVMSWLGFSPLRALPDPETVSWPILQLADDLIMDQSPMELWTTQPHLRTVVDFLGRNVAQLGLQTFERAPDGGREHVRAGELPRLLRKPSPDQTGYEFIREIVADLALYDAAYVLVTGSARDDISAAHEMRTIRPSWVQGTVGATAFNVGGYVVKFPEAPESLVIPADKVIDIHGWNPADARAGMSPVYALKHTLSEQIQAAAFREQLWRRGGRVGSYITRPAPPAAPAWSAEARNKFQRQFSSEWSGNGSKAGGVPLLDEGMELKRVGFSAKEEQFIEANKLALATVASVYHVNPTMVGLLDNANYSNVREFRRMLYGETLGPIIRQLEERLNAFLLPKLDVDNEKFYVEFNTESRLRGSFEEQAAVMSTSIGGPWLTVNEGRQRQNLPAVDGGDALIRPLNVTQNGDSEPIPAEPADDTPTPTEGG